MTYIMRIAERCAQAGVRVVRAPDCERRGNGQSWAARVEGIVNHHTAGGRNIFLDQILVKGRRDLPGPLTNFATLYDGDLCVVAAHPGNHAGASGGWDTAPLPRTSTFNRQAVGNEIQYPGTEPMSPAQWRTILILNRIALEEIGYARHWDRIKFHNGTSVTGKWDPGYAPGKTYDVRAFRRDVAAGTQEEDDMNANQDRMLREIHKQLHGPWETTRFGVDKQESRTLVDLVRGIDLELVSRINLAGRPGPESDTMLGHAATVRADIRALREQLDRVEATLPKA